MPELHTLLFSGQELQNKTQGINIPKLDLVDSEDENRDESDLALHEGTPRNAEDSRSDVVDSLEVPENAEKTQTPEVADAAHGQEVRDGSAQSSKSLPVGTETEVAKPETGDDVGFRGYGDEDPRLQMMFAQTLGHQMAQFPALGPQGPVLSDDRRFGGYNPHGLGPQEVDTQAHPGGDYYIEATVEKIRMEPPVPLPDNRHPEQPGIQGYYPVPIPLAQPNHEPYEMESPSTGHSNQPSQDYGPRQYTDDSQGFVEYQDPGAPHQTYSASTQYSLPPKPAGPDYITLNKKNLKNPPKKSYKHIYSRKKEIENEQSVLMSPPPKKTEQNTIIPSPKTKSPLRPTHAQNKDNQQPMTAEEFWKRRAANLERRKAGSGSGRGLRKFPSESRVDELRPHRVPPVDGTPPHAMAEPIRSEVMRSPRGHGQPITQTVYTEDGQRVSVDINLKLVSPPPIGSPGHPYNQAQPRFNFYHQGPPPAAQAQQYYGYASAPPRMPTQHTYGYGAPSNQFSYRSPVQPPAQPGRPVWGQVRNNKKMLCLNFGKTLADFPQSFC